MRIQKLKIVGSALILATGIGAFSAFAHESDGEGISMMSGDMGGMTQMMSMMSDMHPHERTAMAEACINMMQSQGMDKTEAEAK